MSDRTKLLALGAAALGAAAIAWLWHRSSSWPTAVPTLPASGRAADGAPAHVRMPEAVALEPEASPAERQAAGLGSAELTVRIEAECEASPFVAITLSRDDGTWTETKLIRGARTWSSLVPGRYRVRAESRGWVPIELELDLPRAGSRDDVALPLVATAHIRGRVVDARTGAPVERFTIVPELRTYDREERVMHDRTEAWEFRAPDGSFCIAGGVGAVSSVAPVRSELCLDVVADGYEEQIAAPIPWSLDLVIDDLVIALQPSDEVLATVEGRVIDAATGAAVAGADVVMVEGDGAPAWLGVGPDGLVNVEGEIGTQERELRERTRSGRTKSASDGSFRIEVEAPRVLRAVAHAPGFRLAWSEPIALAPGARTPPTLLALARGASLRGMVVVAEEERELLELTRVRVRRNETVRDVALAEDGTFRVDGLDGGVYEVSVEGRVRGFEPPNGWPVDMPLVTRQVAIEDGHEVEIEIVVGSAAEGAVLAGRVIRPADDRIVSWIVATYRDRSPSGRLHLRPLRADGSFRLAGVPDGRIDLIVLGYERERSRVAFGLRTVEVSGASSPADIEIDLSSPALALRGASGQRPLGTSIEVFASDQDEFYATFLREAVTVDPDEHGRAVIYGLRPGRYVLRYGNAEFGARADVTIPADPGAVIEAAFE